MLERGVYVNEVDMMFQTILLHQDGHDDTVGVRQERKERQRGSDECACPLATEINGGTGEDSSLLH